MTPEQEARLPKYARDEIDRLRRLAGGEAPVAEAFRVPMPDGRRFVDVEVALYGLRLTGSGALWTEATMDPRVLAVVVS